MLQNFWSLQKSHFLIKNNYYFTNYIAHKPVLFLWQNLNTITILVLEKFILEYSVKNMYKSILVTSRLAPVLLLQLCFLQYLIIGL